MCGCKQKFCLSTNAAASWFQILLFAAESCCPHGLAPLLCFCCSTSFLSRVTPARPLQWPPQSCCSGRQTPPAVRQASPCCWSQPWLTLASQVGVGYVQEAVMLPVRLIHTPCIPRHTAESFSIQSNQRYDLVTPPPAAAAAVCAAGRFSILLNMPLSCELSTLQAPAGMGWCCSGQAQPPTCSPSPVHHSLRLWLMCRGAGRRCQT